MPAIAFQVPDIAAIATLQLKPKGSDENVACVKSQVSNGKTADVPAVAYISAGVAGAALVLTGVTAASSAFTGGSGAAASSAGGAGTISPSFTEVFGWLQGMAMNGMLSVNYPQVYRSFSKNFAFSTGLIPWGQMQTAIDNFRASTGGNLTQSSFQFLQNATLVFPDGSQDSSERSSLGKAKRAFDYFSQLAAREIETSVGNDGSNTTIDAPGAPESIRVAVRGIEAYVNQLSIPSANTFMTVLLIVAIVIAAIAVGILFVKVVLEFWALFGSFPESLTGFRKHYWGSIARAITNLILILYGVWVLYCVFQFTNGDSWAAKTLAGVTLAIFTGILGFFSYKIWSVARQLKNSEGDASALYDDKNIWVKYSLFYESYRRDYWWIFVPTIGYMFARGCILAAADGHGMVQSGAQLAVEAVMLILLLWSRPYERRSGNIINISIQVVRVLSVVCILVFVEEFGIAQTTQTVTGVVLIAVQSALTGILAILIIWNAVIACCKENPHRKRRKEMGKRELLPLNLTFLTTSTLIMSCDHITFTNNPKEKIQRDLDTLTPLDARNSLLNDRKSGLHGTMESFSIAKTGLAARGNSSPDPYLDPANPYRAPPSQRSHSSGGSVDEASTALMGSVSPIGHSDPRQPTLPNIGGVGAGYRAAPPAYGSAYGYGGYR